MIGIGSGKRRADGDYVQLSLIGLSSSRRGTRCGLRLAPPGFWASRPPGEGRT